MSGSGIDAVATNARSSRWRGGLSIQSKLLIMLLGVSLVSSVVVGAIGFINGRQSLQAAAIDQLTTIRELRADAIEREFQSLQTGVELDSRNASAVEGTKAFVDGFAALKDVEVTEEQAASVAAFYEDEFVPALEDRSQLEYVSSTFVPATAAGTYLQSFYTAGRAYDDYDAGLALSDAGDGSAWSAANATFGPYFQSLVETLNYEDVVLLDRDGNVVYSAYKSVDLGVDIHEEPYSDSSLAGAFDEVMLSGSLNKVVTTDFERYLPSLGLPTSWVVSPVGEGSDIIGAMAVQIPTDQINEVMTGDGNWSEQGLGETGEVYLVGRDDLMRSNSRQLLEDPDEYAQLAIEGGTAPSIAKRAAQVNGNVLLQPVNTFAVEEAQTGRSGITTGIGYLGSDSVTAYAPLEIDGLDWVIIARMDSSEAFAPVTDFTRNVLLSMLGILLVVSLLSLLLAQVFTRPVHRLVGAVRRVAEGDLDVQVPQGSRDEFGDLGSAFNDMASSLRIKQELIDEQKIENEKLLLTLMPESVAAKYRQGDEAITEAHENVSVVFAEMVGFDELAKGLSGEEEIGLLNTLMRGFDEAAEKSGVEKVRTLRGGYLASSGLVVPRVDNVRRSVEFARSLVDVLERFNAQNGTHISLRAGVDTGAVTSGLVARTTLAYDLWGDAVSLAYRVRSVTGEPGIYVSQAVRDRTQELVTYVEAGTVEAQGKTETVWKVA
ncbi:adenylate/guanylate cyclase domain-containing protein [Microbacterium sp. A93]